MKHLFSTRVRVVLVAAVLLAAALMLVTTITGLSIPDLFVKGVLTPIRTGASKLTVQAERYYSYIFRYEALQAENDALREQIANMEDQARLFDSISRENDRLREVTGLQAKHEDYKLVDSYIIGWSSNDWTNTFTIDRGTSSGIERNMVAITSNGAVVNRPKRSPARS